MVADLELSTFGKQFEAKIYDCDRDLTLESFIASLKYQDYIPRELSIVYLITTNPLFESTNALGRCGMAYQLTTAQNASEVTFAIQVKFDNDFFRNSTFNITVYTPEKEILSQKYWHIINEKPSNNQFKFMDFDIKYRHTTIFGLDRQTNGRIVWKVDPKQFSSSIDLDYNNTGSKHQSTNIYFKGFFPEENSKSDMIKFKQCKPERVNIFDQTIMGPSSLDCIYALTSFRTYNLTVNQTYESYNRSKTTNLMFPLMRDTDIDWGQLDGIMETYHNVIKDFGGKKLFPPVNHLFGVGGHWMRHHIKTCIITSSFMLTPQLEIVPEVLDVEWTLYYNYEKRNINYEIYAKVNSDSANSVVSTGRFSFPL